MKGEVVSRRVGEISEEVEERRMRRSLNGGLHRLKK